MISRTKELQTKQGMSQKSCKANQVTLSQSKYSKISTRYCLNKPKLLNQFKKSPLFQQSFRNLKPYTQRYTYNEKTMSFEKQNLVDKINNTDFQVNYNVIESKQNLNNSTAQKLVKLRKNRTLLTQNNCYVKALLNTSNQKENNNDSQLFKKKPGPSLASFKRKRTEINENKIKSHNQKKLNYSNIKYLNPFASQIVQQKPPQQFLRQYIKSNPINSVQNDVSYLKEKFLKFSQQQSQLKTSKNLKMSSTPVKRQKTVFSSTATNSNFGLKTSTKGKKKRTIFKLNNEKYFNYNQDSEEDNQLMKSKVEQQLRQKQQLKKLVDEEIKKFYDVVEQIKRLGYAQEKINEWIWQWCQNNKKFLQNILFKKMAYRSTLIDSKVMFKLQSFQQAKLNGYSFKRLINQHQLPLQPEDLLELNSFIEDILISKQYYELNRLKDQVEQTSNKIRTDFLTMKDQKVDDILKIIEKFDNQKKLKPMEYYQMLGFYEDVKRLEMHFGKVKGLEKANRRKCQNITQVEIQVIRKRGGVK